MAFNPTQKKMMGVGACMVVLALIIFASNTPDGPSAKLKQQANSRTAMAGFAKTEINMIKSVQREYKNCLVGSSYAYLRCPMGGNLYLLFLGGVALIGAGALFPIGGRDNT